MAKGSIKDWAAKAAQRIRFEFVSEGFDRSNMLPTEARIAAIITTFAEPLVELVRASRREHYHCGDSWYCCPECRSPDHGYDHGPTHHPSECTCGADEWNARVDAALAGARDAPPKARG